MSTTLSQLLQEADLPPAMSEDLDALMTALRALTPATAPEPSPQLAALMAHPVAPHRYRFRRGAVAAVAAVIGSFTLTGVAAAVEILPAPAQQFVSDLSQKYLPFQFPAPITIEGEEQPKQKTPDDEAPLAPATTDEPAQKDPTPDESDNPEPTKEPTSEPTKAPTKEPSPEVSPSAPAAPSDPPPSPSAPAPSDAPSPTLGAEEPTESPSAGGTTSPSPSGDSTEPGHARENETGTPTPSPTPSAPLPSGSTSPSGG